MDTAWIPIFVLSFSECVAPSGKTVCQEHEFQLEFLSQAQCEEAREQLIAAKDALQTVIVDKDKSRCAASARQQEVYASLAEVSGTVQDSETWIAPASTSVTNNSTRVAHRQRLESLPTCEQAKGIAPCKIGEIIVEEAVAPKKVEVWRQGK